MSMYIVFFGKSQDFTTYYYDRNNPIHDFNSVIKDFDLLESKIFTVDDIKNTEILSRYFFTAQGKSFCLLKLYSFAQAYSGNRIAGSIYGVGLLSDKDIHLSKGNLDLLRAAKDNFAKLSLDGVKFKKSNFQEDANRIWKAIVSSNDGNHLDKVVTSNLKVNESGGQVSFYVKDLFADAIKLNDRISQQDTVYFSKDLEHLKRTQAKWGKDNFPIYWEQNSQFVTYTEPVIPKQTAGGDLPKATDIDDITRLRAELSDSQYDNRNLQYDLEKIKRKQQLFLYIIYGLAGMVVFLLVYILFFSERNKNVIIEPTVAVQDRRPTDLLKHDPISTFLIDSNSVENGLAFLKSVRYIYSFNVKQSLYDSSKFHRHFEDVEKIAEKNKIMIEKIREVYMLKCDELSKLPPTKKTPQQLKSNSRE